MKHSMLALGKTIGKTLFSKVGYQIVPVRSVHRSSTVDFDEEIKDLYRYVQPYTYTSIERIAALRDATRYVVAHNIPGDIVECGVWKGGSMMAIARTLNESNCSDRGLYLFDTFSGMTSPKDVDIDYMGRAASELMEERDNTWSSASEDDVRRVMEQTGYNTDMIFYVKGKVEDTLPSQAPKQIALLRLDTDWYDSTYHEMVHLYPRLSRGGVLIIDDYGHWKGARRAIDQYFAEQKLKLLLCRIDYTGRIAVNLGV